MKAEVFFSLETFSNYTIIASCPVNSMSCGYSETKYIYDVPPISNTSTHQFNAAFSIGLKYEATKSENRMFTTWAKKSSMSSTSLMREVHAEALNVMENYTIISYPSEKFVTYVIPKESKGVASESLGMVITKYVYF